MPPPCGTAISFLPIQKIWSTATFAGPSVPLAHVPPLFDVPQMPTSPATYSGVVSTGATTILFIRAAGKVGGYVEPVHPVVGGLPHVARVVTPERREYPAARRHRQARALSPRKTRIAQTPRRRAARAVGSKINCPAVVPDINYVRVSG